MQRIFLSIVAISAACFAADPLDKVLAAGKLTRADVHFDRELMDFYGGGPYRLKFFDLLVDRPLEIPYYNRLFVHQLFQSQARLAPAVFFGSMRTDASVRRGLIEHPYTSVKNRLSGIEGEGGRSLVSSIEHLLKISGTSADPGKISKKLPKLDSTIEEALAVLIWSEVDAIEMRNLALRQLSASELDRLYEKSLGYIGEDTTLTIDDRYFVEDAIARIEFPLLYAGAEDLALVLDSILPVIDNARSSLPAFSFETPYGAVAVGSPGNDSYSGNYLLLIEPGGDDTYQRAGANPDANHPLSIVIDLGGKDVYSNSSVAPALAAGLLGIGILVDERGNDTYETRGPGLGAGLFGIGLLADRSGDDYYEGYMNCEGAGIFGTGALIDSSGNDTYRAFYGTQGYGFTKGCGLLLDLSGDDHYIARDDSILFPSAQTKEHNSSMAQGFGFGKRADFSDGRSLAGGVGVLADAQGSDSYSAGLFAQGCGYWYGVGLLSDGDGDDTFSGVWYVQGSGAHFAVGVLDNVAGNDVYNATMNMAQGAGHDYTVGYLLDEGGNDTYNAPNLSLGGGNANGIGIFWDKGGDDIYNVTAATTLGLANIGSRGGLRDSCLCLGLFMDTGGGSDKYPDGKKAANNKCWFNPGADTINPISTETGIGIDE